MKKDTVALFILTVVISGIVYAITLCPTVEFIDSGELAMACKHLGIAHPTGYPLYTILGNLAARFPAGTLIIRENVLSLLFTAFAAGFLFLFVLQILRKYRFPFGGKSAAAFVAIFTAFSPVWWSQGTTNEVYSLNLLLIPVSLWSLSNYAKAGKENYRWLVFSAYTLGLCLANHLSAVYVIPGVLYIIIVEIRHSRLRLKSLWPLALFILFPVTLYLVLPIRARFKPFLNWGNVNDSYFFYKHITGWQYRVWMFTNPLGIFDNLSTRIGPAIGLIYDQFKWYGLLPAVAGIWVVWIRYRRFLYFSILIWLANLVYVLNYDIVDIEAYYLPIIIVSSIFIALAAVEGIRLLESKGKRTLSYFLLGLLALLPIANLITNYQKANRGDKIFARQGVLDLASSIEQGGVAIIENWDFYSPWLYMRFEENFRPDMVLLDKELMRRSWYIDFIRRNHPEIYERSRPAFEDFVSKVADYERGLQYNPNVLDKAYNGMFDSIILNENPLHPVYTNIFGDKTFAKGRPLIPGGIMFRFGSADIFQPRPRFKFDESVWSDPRTNKDTRVGYLLTYYARAFESRQKYCAFFGQSDEAAYYTDLKTKVKAMIGDIK
jgi:hypothetical protein